MHEQSEQLARAVAVFKLSSGWQSSGGMLPGGGSAPASLPGRQVPPEAASLPVLQPPSAA
jgi:hypothetical protein